MSRRMLITLMAAALAIVVTTGAGRAQAPAPTPPADHEQLAPAAPEPEWDAMEFDDDFDFDLMAMDDADDAPPEAPPAPGMGPRSGGMAPRAGMGHGGMGSGMGMGPGMRMGPGGGRMAPGMRMGGMRGGPELGLTKEQRDKLAELRDRQMRAGIQSRASLQLAQLDLMKAMRADRPDRAAINLQIDKIAKMRGDLQKARVGSMLDFRALLTDEQREKLHERRGEGPPMRMRIRERIRGDAQ